MVDTNFLMTFFLLSSKIPRQAKKNSFRRVRETPHLDYLNDVLFAKLENTSPSRKEQLPSGS